MIWWLVDHANVIYLLLIFAGLVLALLYRQTRRVKFLVWLGGLIGVAALFWLMCRFVVTDRKQIEINLRELAQATLDRDAAKMQALLHPKFQFRSFNRTDAVNFAIQRSKMVQVKGFHIWEFAVEELSRDPGTAKISFRLRVDGAGDQMFLAICRGTLVLENERWLLRTFEVYPPVANTDQPAQF